MAHLFKKNDTASILANVEETIRVEDGMVSFVVNKGKGSAEQSLSTDDFRSVVGVLRSFVEGGIPNEATPTPADIVRQTISFDGETDTISFRMENGKGAKPVRVSAREFAPLVTFLGECASMIGADAPVTGEETPAPAKSKRKSD
jgi:hypothetical protein